MPKRKLAVFSAAIAALLAVLVLSVVMSVHHYEKTVLITLDAEGNQMQGNEVGLKEIKRQLSEYEEDSSTGTILWKGSVCVTKYKAWGGRTTTYYVCPYLVVTSSETISETPSEWTLALRFAACATEGESLAAINRDFAVRNITLSCRSGKSAAILNAAYTDMDMTEVNGDTVYYEFRDKEEISADTEIYAKLTLADKSILGELLNEKDADNQKDSVIVNWTFTLEEDGRLVNNFDGVQVEMPYAVEAADD